MFDVLTYEKGASVLRMLEQYIGPTVFRDGVRRYLDRHAFGNTETADLWCALGEASELPIPEVMDGWIFHPGYPLIDVEKTAGGPCGAAPAAFPLPGRRARFGRGTRLANAGAAAIS